MRRLGLIAVVFAFSFASACAAPPPPPPAAPPDTTAADTAAINKLRSDYAAAFEAADADKLASLMTDDSTSMQVDQPTVTGRAAQLESMKGLFSMMTVNDFTITSGEMKLMGSYAFDRGTVSASMTPKAKGAKPQASETRYLVILQKGADGAWRLMQDINNNVPPPPAPPRK